MTDRRAVVVGAVIVSGGRVLAARRRRPEAESDDAGSWEFPGGKVEAGEDPRDALAREIREELGAKVSVGEEIRGEDGPWPISDRYALRLFLATVDGRQPRPGPDHDALRWLGGAELDAVDWLPADQLALPHVRQRLRDA